MLVVGSGIDKLCSSLYNKYQSAITLKVHYEVRHHTSVYRSKIREPDYDEPDYDEPDFNRPDFDIAPSR